MQHTLLFLQGWEWIILALLILLLFGGKKIPELMKGLGKGIKSFKEGMKDATATDKPADAAPAEKVTGQTIDVEVKEKTKS